MGAFFSTKYDIKKIIKTRKMCEKGTVNPRCVGVGAVGLQKILASVLCLSFSGDNDTFVHG